MSQPNAADAPATVKPCVVKSLPERLMQDSTRVAIAVNPLNGLLASPAPAAANGHGTVPDPPQHLTVRVGKKWDNQPRVLSVSFMEPASARLQQLILTHLNAWNETCCISFKLASQGSGQVRISFGPGGYWSYLGTDILLIPPHQQTMNLDGFTENMPESEFRRVVRHEAGHTLGFEHEHMRQELVAQIDPEKAYRFFWNNQGWDRPTVDAQVLTPLDKKSIMGTPADATSIMCYQLPPEIMKNGAAGIPGGLDINPTDYAFAGRLYPKRPQQAEGMLATAAVSGNGQEWGQEQDVKFSAALLEQFDQDTLL